MTSTIVRSALTIAAVLALAAPAAAAGPRAHWKQLPTHHTAGQLSNARADHALRLRPTQEATLTCRGVSEPDVVAVTVKGTALTPTVDTSRLQWNETTRRYEPAPNPVVQITWAVAPWGHVYFNPSYTTPVGELSNFSPRTVVASWRCG